MNKIMGTSRISGISDAEPASNPALHSGSESEIGNRVNMINEIIGDIGIQTTRIVAQLASVTEAESVTSKMEATPARAPTTSPLGSDLDMIYGRLESLQARLNELQSSIRV